MLLEDPKISVPAFSDARISAGVGWFICGLTFANVPVHGHENDGSQVQTAQHIQRKKEKKSSYRLSRLPIKFAWKLICKSDLVQLLHHLWKRMTASKDILIFGPQSILLTEAFKHIPTSKTREASWGEGERERQECLRHGSCLE